MNGILKPEKSVKEIILNFVDVDIDIEYGNENIFEYEDFPENIEIENYVENEKWYLNVKPKSDSFISKMFGFSFNFSSGGYVKLKINSDILNISINNVNGDVSLNKVSLNNFYVKSISGDTGIYNSKIKFLEFYTTSGDLETTNSPIYSLNIKTISGDCELDYLTENFKEAKIKTVSGDIDLYIAGKEEVFINKNTAPSGDVHTNLSLKFEHSTDRFINFKSVSGDLTIKEKKKTQNNDVVFEENKKTKINNLLTPEEQKILELYNAGKINREFAIELLENVGYTQSDAESFLNDYIGGDNK
ncbi:DUF4097 family beta strand repeat-containing protein [Marinitoga aeolica]|uniref:DUF4097 family beta strand repeat protein n=1 Tax=Marinitoga aeolica TaxID=2809031 RepID=A0ABY8PQY9_9BACT|nr:DUF4097 family beta strand repeat-containing protein [Marinitoga aeolica]WGS65040.1 DUF4097 family beta strand repeat protein [Marinitoga aeolica]